LVAAIEASATRAPEGSRTTPAIAPVPDIYALSGEASARERATIRRSWGTKAKPLLFIKNLREIKARQYDL
jgi:hypothetical protein